MSSLDFLVKELSFERRRFFFSYSRMAKSSREGRRFHPPPGLPFLPSLDFFSAEPRPGLLPGEADDRPVLPLVEVGDLFREGDRFFSAVCLSDFLSSELCRDEEERFFSSSDPLLLFLSDEGCPRFLLLPSVSSLCRFWFRLREDGFFSGRALLERLLFPSEVVSPPSPPPPVALRDDDDDVFFFSVDDRRLSCDRCRSCAFSEPRRRRSLEVAAVSWRCSLC
mmetsp:Transcript_24389/g.58864  ORF Transcript_24389/g.58864 Transcript_24389/m.58864 type:complete len:223 (+) Transcript_24389:601-1269(+)